MPARRTNRKQEKIQKQAPEAQASLPNLPSPQKAAPAGPETPLVINGRTMRATDSVVREPGRTGYNPRYVAGLENYVAERFDTVRIITLTASAPALLPTPSSTTPSDSASHSPSPFRFHLLALLSANRGWGNTPAAARPWGLAPVLGIGGEKELRPGLSVAAQVGFTWFNGLKVTKEVQSYRYSFGVDSTAISVEYRRLLQFTLPVSVLYRLSPRWSVFAGLGVNYAFEVQSRLKDDDNAPSTVFGYRDGWRRLDGFAQAGVRANISPRLGAVVQYQQGFADMTENSFFQQNATQRQSRIMLGLRYELKGHRK